MASREGLHGLVLQTDTFSETWQVISWMIALLFACLGLISHCVRNIPMVSDMMSFVFKSRKIATHAQKSFPSLYAVNSVNKTIDC